jgi:hypothetical protein
MNRRLSARILAPIVCGGFLVLACGAKTTTPTPPPPVDPRPVASFSATGGDGSVGLAWEMPSDESVSGAVVRFSNDTCPASPATGTAVPNGSSGRFSLYSTSFDHSGLSDQSRYYYSVFTFTSDDRYSKRDTASARPLPPNIDTAWSSFEAGNYAGALSQFSGLIQRDPGNGEAYNGRSWSKLYLRDWSGSLADFQQAVANGVTSGEPLAGREIALFESDPPNYTDAVAAADQLLVDHAYFSFSHDSAIDWRDVRLIKAQAHFALRDYTAANEQVGSLGGTRADPASPTFVQDLLAKLQSLGTAIRG